MGNANGGNRQTPRHQSLIQKILLSPFGFLYRLWTFTIRLKYDGAIQKEIIADATQPLVILLWHNRLFIAGEWHRRFRKKISCYGLISGSRDGAWLETFYGWAGIRAVRGSRNKRGMQAIRDLVKVVKSGFDVGVTPDGSRGPKYQAKSGALALARLTKSPVLLLSFEYSRAIRLNSWDKFAIPLPFSSVIATTHLLDNAELFKERTLDEATRFAERQLNLITQD